MTFLSLMLCTSYIPVCTVTSFILLNDKEYFVTVFGRWWLSLVSFVGMRGLFIPTYHVRKSLLDGNPSLALDLIAHQSYTKGPSINYVVSGGEGVNYSRFYLVKRRPRGANCQFWDDIVYGPPVTADLLFTWHDSTVPNYFVTFTTQGHIQDFTLHCKYIGCNK